MEKLKADFKSWRTTAVGFLGGLVICLTQIIAILDNDPETVFQLSIFMAGLGLVGVGIFAKDGDKSSEDVGIK